MLLHKRIWHAIFFSGRHINVKTSNPRFHSLTSLRGAYDNRKKDDEQGKNKFSR